jgi:hypothetical protein
VVESRDIVFFKEGLPPPTLNEARRQQDVADVPPVVQPAPEHLLEPLTLSTPPTLPIPLVTPHTASTVQPHDEPTDVESNEDEESEEDAESSARPIHDVSYGHITLRVVLPSVA